MLSSLPMAKSEVETQALAQKAVTVLVEEVEALLSDATPRLPWLAIEEKAPMLAEWVEAALVHSSLTSIFDENAIIEGIKARIARLRSSACGANQ